MSKAFPYGKAIGVGKGNAVLDAGSFKPAGPKGLGARRERAPALVEQLPAGRRAALGHRPPAVRRRPADRLHVPGPHARGRHQLARACQARGATAPGFAGNILIGRGQDYAWSLTSAGSDLIDNFVETLCGGSQHQVPLQGPCRAMGTVDAGTIKGSGRVVYRTTVHGPVTGYAKVDGKTVAVSRKRASYGRTSSGSSPSATSRPARSARPTTFRDALASSPFTFNVGYADDRDIAMYSAGQLPVRDPRVDPRLPDQGHGRIRVEGLPRRPSTRTRSTRPAACS